MIICPGRLSTIMASNLDRCCPVVIAPRRAFGGIGRQGSWIWPVFGPPGFEGPVV